MGKRKHSADLTGRGINSTDHSEPKDEGRNVSHTKAPSTTLHALKFFPFDERVVTSEQEAARNTSPD